jgi:hypothetical protein
VVVAVVDGAGNVLASDRIRTDDGTFDIGVDQPLTGDELVVFSTFYGDGDHVVFAVLHPDGSGTVEPDSTVAPVWSWNAAVPENGDVGALTVREADGSGAIFMFVLGFATLGIVSDDVLGGDQGAIASLAILWAPDLAWSCGSCAGAYPQQLDGGGEVANSVWIGDEAGGSGAWGYPVLLHELGHYVARNYSRDDSPGGDHYVGYPVVPPFAWIEGWATFFSLSTFSRWIGEPFSLYWDIQEGSSFWVDCARALYSSGDAMQRPDPDGGLAQDLDENYVSAMLWDLWDGADVAETGQDDGTALGTDVVLRAIASDRFLSYDRGASGVDFVDFVDAVLCDGPQLASDVEGTVTGELGFPYDDAPQCP